MARNKNELGEGGGGAVEGDLENCAYLWKNPGYAPGSLVVEMHVLAVTLRVNKPN